MKKSWFVTLVIFLTLLLVGVGLYFFFPTFTKIGTITPNDNSPLFGNIGENPNGGGTQATSSVPSTPSTPQEENQTPIGQEIGFKAFKVGDYQVSSIQPLDFKVGTTSTTTLLLSIGKGSGTVRVYDPQTNTTAIIGTISVPNIIASEFTSNGTYVVVQSQENDTVKTIVLKSEPRTLKEERFFSPVFSASNINSFFIEGNTIYFIEKIQSGSELYMYVPSTGKRTLLYRGVFSDLYGFSRQGNIFLSTKAAVGTQGFIFKLDTKNSLMTKLASGIALLGVPNQTGNFILITEFYENGAEAGLLEVATKERNFLSLETLKEKCVPDFSTKTFMFCGIPQNIPQNMPDAWYMGKVSTNDTLYLIDTEQGSLSALASTEEDVDVISPQSSRYSGILTFVNKKDSSPWIIISK